MKLLIKKFNLYFFLFSFILAAFILSSCSRYDSNSVDAQSSDSSALISTGEVVDIEIKIYSFVFDGTAEILSLDKNGNFEASVSISGFDQDQIVSGTLTNKILSLEDFNMNHSMASGKVSDFEGKVNKKNDVEGDFLFTLSESDLYPEAAGWKIKGSFTISKKKVVESVSYSEFLNASEHDLKMTIAGFSFSGSAEITDYNSKTGDVTAVFHADGLDEGIPVMGKVSGLSITIDPFEIDHDYAAGDVSNIQGTYDSSMNAVTGSYSFLLQESDLFSDYEGSSFDGEFTLSLSN